MACGVFPQTADPKEFLQTIFISQADSKPILSLFMGIPEEKLQTIPMLLGFLMASMVSNAALHPLTFLPLTRMLSYVFVLPTNS
jgi:hypothetical protein